MPMYNSIEYSGNYIKTSGSLWQYYRDEPALTLMLSLLLIFMLLITVLRVSLNKK